MCAIARIDRFNDQWPDAEFGPAHIVLSDANLGDGHIDWCLGLLDSLLDGTPWPEPPESRLRPEIYADDDRAEMEATRAFLLELRALPESEREEPGDVRCA